MSRKQNQIMVDFIAIYRSEPCLWQVKASEYHDRAKKEAAYNKLVKKLEELEPGATKKTVVAKINSLRSSFRKEQKKVEASKKFGASAASIYKPVLWFYDLFDFLQDQDTPRASLSNLDSETDEESVGNPLPVEEDMNDDVEGSTSTIADAQVTQSKTPITSRSGSNRRRQINNDLSAEVLTTVRDHFKTTKEQPDRYDLIGKTVAVRLRGLEKRLALIAEKKINDVLFEAEMGYLSTLPKRDYLNDPSSANCSTE